LKGAVAGGISVSSGHGLAPVPYARQHRARFRPGVAASGVLFVFSRESFVIQSFTCRRHCRSIRLYLRASANSDVSPLPVARAYPGSSLVGGSPGSGLSIIFYTYKRIYVSVCLSVFLMHGYSFQRLACGSPRIYLSPFTDDFSGEEHYIYNASLYLLDS